MDNIEVKVGPDRIKSFQQALVDTLPVLVFSILGVGAFFGMMLLVAVYSGGPEKGIDYSPFVFSVVLALSIVAFGVCHQSMVKAYLWCRLENDAMVFFWKSNIFPEKRIPYRWVTTFVLDKRKKYGGVLYLRNGRGLMGLPSSRIFLKGDITALKQIYSNLRLHCDHLELKVIQSRFQPPTSGSFD